MHAKFKLIVTLFVFYSLSIFGQEPAKTDAEGKTFELPPFSKLRVYTGIELKLIPSDTNKAVVYGDNLEDIVLSSKKGTLRIKLKADAVFKLGYNLVELYYTESLDLIDINQGSKFSTDAVIDQTYLRLKINEESTFIAPLDVAHLEATVSTGSKLFLDGKATITELKINTGGSCEAEELITTQTTITVLAGGRAYVHASQLLDARVTAGGLVRVYGNPEKRITKKIVSGKILFMD